nr:unnamed protein product [Digitaria exilis]
MADGASSSGGARDGGQSEVIDYGRRSTTCGYCRSSRPTSISHGMWANSLKADDYQEKLAMTMERLGKLDGFEVKACNGHLNFYLSANPAMRNHTGVVPAQASDNSSRSKQSSVNKVSMKHPQKRKSLEIRMSTSHFDPEEFALYRRWVRSDLAKPLLDKSQYSILSDYATMQDETHQPQICGPSDDSSSKGDQHESHSDDDDEDFNDYESEMMVDEELVDSEKADTTESGSCINDIENITLHLNGSKVKYKDLQQMFGPIERRHLNALEGQLRRYAEVVGKELSDRMVYCLS